VRLPAITLVAILSFCSCDIFIEDWGVEGAPCESEDDCLEKFTCDLGEHRCIIRPEFGRECQGPQDCGSMEFGLCIFFPAVEKSFCTRQCGAAEDCADMGARCTFSDPLIMEAFCAEPEWTFSEFGCMCNDQGIGCKSGPCVEFEPLLGGKICSKNCPDCPPRAECGMPRDMEPETCGYPAWFGFWAPCNTNQDCGDHFPLYPECHDFSDCTRICSNVEPCPEGMRCEPPGGGLCVLIK